MRKLSWMILPVLMLCGVLSVAAQDAEKDAGKSDSTAKTDEKNDSAEANEDGESEDTEAEEEALATATLDKKAPDFTLKNANGTEVKLSDYKDKIVVLEWINFDCPWCKMHYEDSDALVKMHKEMRDAGVVWLLVCSSAEGKQGNFDAETLKKRMDKVGVKADFYLVDADGVVGKKYEAKTTPHCYVIDKSGKLRYRGALDNMRQRMKDKTLDEVNYVKQAVDAITDGKKLDNTDTKPYG
ncbi:MAG: redoxin domain-containing protein [Planctomycetes bacterium]|nr:redoxin domain-containing protein [Planctomycetota bacterium]MCA8935466.1 redoxin domain-containing protein [Planctomycetota bacterium]MCA8946421.1 redoxin domain-containing protein [Planctomycetota bacterium]